MEKRKYFAEEDSESKDSVSPEENPDYSTDEDYDPEPKLKKRVSKRKKDFVEEDSDSQEKNSNSEAKKPKKKQKPKKKLKQKNKVSKTKSKKLTEYELLVQKNKEERLAFLDSLKIDEIKDSFAEAVAGLKPKRRKYEKRPPVAQRKIQRRSAKMDKDLSEEALEAQAMAKALASMKKETVNKKGVYRSKKLPKIKKRSRKSRKVQEKEAEAPHVSPAPQLSPAPQVSPALQFKDVLLEDRLFEDFTQDFSDLDKGNTDPFYGYASHFQKMQLLKAPFRIFGSQIITSLDFHPMREKIIIASSASQLGQLALWNMNSDSDPYIFEPHTGGISHLKFIPEQPHLIMTSSSDGTLKCADLVKRELTEVYEVPTPEFCTYFDFLSPSSVLLAQKNGNISAVDYRSKEKSVVTHKCYDSPVKSVSVHPVDKNYFISSEKKGTVSLWDLRKLKTNPIMHVNHYMKDLQLALFSPLTGRSVLVSSHGKVTLYDSYVGSCLVYQRTIERHRSQNPARQKISQAMWLPNTDNAFVVGSKDLPKRIEIYNDRGINIFNFSHEELNSFTPIHIFHPSIPVLAGAASTGKVFVVGAL